MSNRTAKHFATIHLLFVCVIISIRVFLSFYRPFSVNFSVLLTNFAIIPTDCQCSRGRISGFNVVLRIKVTRYRRQYLGKYLAPATSRLSQSPAGEWLSPEGVLFIRYRDTGIQPSNRGANQPLNPLSLSPALLQTPPRSPSAARHSTSTPVSVEFPCGVASAPATSPYALGNPGASVSSDLKILSASPAIRSLIVRRGVRQAVR